jgi:predicted small lipoprotein YifL
VIPRPFPRLEFSLSAPGGGEGWGEVGAPREAPTSPSPSPGRRVPSLSPRKRAERPSFAILALVLPLALAGCGKRGPPEPPPGEPVTYPRTYPSE